MKTIKAIFFVTVMLLVAVHTGAQEKKTTFGVILGLNVANVTPAEEGEFDNTSPQSGFHVGFTLDYAFSRNWYLATGLEYTTKGTIIDQSGSDVDIKAAFVQLPLCGGYKFPITDDFAVMAQLGPYFAYGLHGESNYGSSTYDTFGKQIWKDFDCGIIFMTGIEWKKLYFGLGGEAGMVNIMQEGNTASHTSNFKLSVGYRF